MYSGKTYDVLVKLNTKSDKCLVLRQTQILRSTRYKNLQKQSNKNFFTQLLILAYISPKQFYYPHAYRNS